jgi:PAS domain S-box-containing protein/putative nucleotidyltransferase with HDIG domain
VSQIEKWLEERWSDANEYSFDHQFGDQVHRWLDLGDNTYHARIAARMNVAQAKIDYESILLYDVRGRLRLEIGTEHGTNPNLDRLVREAAKTRASQFSDLYRSDARSDMVFLEFITPLVFDDQDRPSIAGVMVLRVDPTHYLYSLIQHWPLQTGSGETLLVRREGDTVLYLNELRHRSDSALTLRMPLTALRTPAVQAVLGTTGALEGDDYRGMPVFSVIRPIRGTPWHFITKVDRDEVLAPMHNVQLVSATITLAAITLAGLVVGFGWRQQARNFALRQRMQEAEKLALAKHFEHLSRNANDLIVLTDENMHIVQINDRALTLIGYQPAEMIGQPLSRFRSVSVREKAAQDYARFQSEGHARYETVLSHRDGSELPVEVGAARVEVDGQNYYQLVVRDISERKQVEKERMVAEDRYLRQRNALITISSSQALSGDDLETAFRRITELDAKTLAVARVSIWRYNRDRTAIQCVDLYELETDRHSAGVELSAAAYPAYFRALLKKDVIAADDAHRDPRTSEFSQSYLKPLGITSMMDAPIYLGDKVDGVLCREHVGPPRQWKADEKTFAIAVANLVSLALGGWERKHNQEKLATAAEQFQGLVEQSIAGIFIISADMRFAYANPRLAEILGCDPADLIGHSAIESAVKSDQALVRASLERCLSGENESQLVAFLGRRPDGSTVDVGAHINRATHAGKPAVIGVVQDISEKKRAETRIQDYIGQLERGMLGTIKAVSVMSELRDPYTYGHEQRVGDLSGAIATEMGLDAHVVRGLQIAGYVHDIGKIVVPAEILAKPTKLTKAEFELIKSHPEQGYEVLKEIDFPWQVAQVALQHHERLDGSGYPQGLKGDQILLEARILAVADVVEAMAAHRPYRPSLGIDAALEEVRKYRGVKYDAAAVDACVRLFHERGYTLKTVL